MCTQAHTFFVSFIFAGVHSAFFSAVLCSRCVYFSPSVSLNVTTRVCVCVCVCVRVCAYDRLRAQQSTKNHSVIQFTYVKHLRIWPNSLLLKNHFEFLLFDGGFFHYSFVRFSVIQSQNKRGETEKRKIISVSVRDFVAIK